MTSTKRKVSVSLDEDLVAEIEQGDHTLSRVANEAIRAGLERQRRMRLLGEMLDDLEDHTGPPEEALVAKYLDLLT